MGPFKVSELPEMDQAAVGGKDKEETSTPPKRLLSGWDTVEEKTALMESGSFLMSGVGFYIRDWTPNFDPRQANLEEIPMWIRLYNLPHEYWKEEIFKSVGEKIGRFIKSNEAVDKLSSCMYARIYVMWKTHLGLPKVVEMRSPKGVWRQDIEIEEIIVKCKICKEWGHEDRDCLSGQKGKGKADRALEEKLLVGAVADQSLGNINPSFVTEAASDEVIRLCSDRQVVEFSHGQGLSLGEEKEDQVCKGSGWEGDSQIEGKRLEVGVGLDEKDIHMSPSKDNGVIGELGSEEEEGLSDDSFGLSAEVGETEVRTIKQSNLNPPKSKGNLRGRKNRQRLLEEVDNMKGQTRLLRFGRDLFSPGQQ
ncbi:uncharacterized protein LOC131049015 [Cryptomeria japonica]|uniref:uncharacterized protein LOC131049015 n=1 Tax=Cryptomeria japonica TaxID=3369 RepID=UPI0027DAAB51|nr:uncharacterized protein LOC131049015 [Cryptomeria japonica]